MKNLNLLLSAGWLMSAWVLYSLAVVWALYKFPWRSLRDSRVVQHLFLGLTFAVALLWLMRVAIYPGLEVHFLGATVLTLMFGWPMALISTAIAGAGSVFFSDVNASVYGIYGVIRGVVPVLVSFSIFKLTDWYLPKHFFIYMFVNCFFGAGIAVFISALFLIGVLWLSASYPLSFLYSEYFVYLPLIMFPEALITGMVMTGMMVYHPDWIKTFDSTVYLDENK
ncbi:MAG TPA: hypothetical protein DCZ12_05720 [Gammaproteobacteria bacterium]|nr:hypothetical protein [Gammaproteobacteria bacterium]